MSRPERLATIAAHYLAHLHARQENAMTTTQRTADRPTCHPEEATWCRDCDLGGPNPPRPRPRAPREVEVAVAHIDMAYGFASGVGVAYEAGVTAGRKAAADERRRTALSIATAFEAHDEPVTSAAQAAELVRRWAQTYAPTT